MITREALMEIKNRLPPSKVIGGYIKLTPYWGTTLRGVSPFTNDHADLMHGGLYVHDHKQSWSDFETGKSGDIFDFIMFRDAHSFEWAVRTLAKLADVKLEEWVIEDDPTISPREAAIALGAAIYPVEYVEPIVEEFAKVPLAHEVSRRVADGVLSHLAGKEADLARDMAILAKRIARPAPRFLTTLNVDAFRAALDLDSQQRTRARLRGA